MSSSATSPAGSAPPCDPGFINDISKQPGRSFDAEELELELRSVWPLMIPIRTPPPLAAHHVPRAYRLGEIHGREGGWEAARGFFERGLEHAQRAREPSLLAEGYRLLADAALHGSDYESARTYYEGAIGAWDALGRQQEAADARLLLVALLVQVGRARSGAGHAEWLRAYGEHAKLSLEGRDELERVLRLADAAGAGERETAQGAS